MLATKRFAAPENLLEEIIRDADYSHLGSELYWDRSSRIRQELLMTRHNFMPEEEWVEFELDFMLGHTFHTEVAQQLLEATKSISNNCENTSKGYIQATMKRSGKRKKRKKMQTEPSVNSTWGVG